MKGFAPCTERPGARDEGGGAGMAFQHCPLGQHQPSSANVSCPRRAAPTLVGPHQDAYLGVDKLHKMDSKEQYNLWTDEVYPYTVWVVGHRSW